MEGGLWRPPHRGAHYTHIGCKNFPAMPRFETISALCSLKIPACFILVLFTQYSSC